MHLPFIPECGAELVPSPVYIYTVPFNSTTSLNNARVLNESSILLLSHFASMTVPIYTQVRNTNNLLASESLQTIYDTLASAPHTSTIANATWGLAVSGSV